MTSGPYQERRAPSGRFLPPDPRVREPHRLTPQLALRVAILGAVALAVFIVLFFRLWSLQVLSGDEYLNAAQSNQLRLIRVDAPRGPLLDRRGRVVVSNVAGTAVELWAGDMPDEPIIVPVQLQPSQIETDQQLLRDEDLLNEEHLRRMDQVLLRRNLDHARMFSRKLSLELQQFIHLYTPEANELRRRIEKYMVMERLIEKEMARRHTY